MENKKRFYIYNSWRKQMELLSPEEQGTILMNLFRYQNGEEIVLTTPMLKMCWTSMEFLLDKDAEMYQKKSDNMKKIGKRNRQKLNDTVKTNNDTVTTSNDTVTTPLEIIRDRFVNDNDNDNDDDNGNGNGGDTRVDTFDTFTKPDRPNPLTGITESQRREIKANEFDAMGWEF